MADNVLADAGSGGATFATDSISGSPDVHYPISKITIGAFDSAGTLLTGGDGTVDAGCLRVTIASNTTGVLSIDDNGANISTDWGGTVPPIGAGTEAAALRVTLATNSTGQITVDTTGTSGLEVVQTTAADLNVTEASAAAILSDTTAMLLDTGSIQTAVETIDDAIFVDDVPFALTTSSVMVSGAIRDDSIAGNLTAIAGDAVPLRVNQKGALWTQNEAMQLDDAAFSPATSWITMIGFEYDDTGTNPVEEGDGGAARMSANRNIYTTLRDAAGNERGVNVTSGNALTVDIVAALPTGANLIGNVGIDQVTANANEVKTLTGSLVALEAGTAEIGKLAAGTAGIGKLTANTGVDIGDVDVTSISAGTNLIGDVGLQPRTSGGVTSVQQLDVDETEDEIKSTVGQVYFIYAINLASAVRYLKLYDTNAAGTTVGTTTPIATFALPTQGDSNGAGFSLAIPQGIVCGTSGISIAATTGFAVADTGAPGNNDVIVTIGFK